MRKSQLVPSSITAWTISELGDFYLRNRIRLVRHASRFLKDRQLAEEVVQDSFMKVILASPELSNEQQAYAYVKRAIDNAIVDAYRHQGRQPQLVSIEDSFFEAELASADSTDFAELISDAENAAVIRQALSLLSPAERAALVMWEIQERSTSEIARELGIKESSVRHTLTRARKSMRKILSTYVIDESRGLTALDLISGASSRVKEISEKSGKAVVSIILIVMSYFSFSHLISQSKFEGVKVSGSSANEVQQNVGARKLEVSEEPLLSDKTQRPFKVKNEPSVSNIKSGSLKFPGLDEAGAPVGFTVTDQTGILGNLYFNGREAVVDDQGIRLTSVAKTSSNAANIFITQTLTQESEKWDYQAVIAFARNGQWIPTTSKVISLQSERLLSGQYLLTTTLQIEKEIATPISIPASASGRDMAMAPSRVVTKVLIDSTKTRVLGQAIQVIERART